MILVRDVFRIAPEGMKDVLQSIRVGRRLLEEMGVKGVRTMTDLTGDNYTLVLESTHESLGAWEALMRDSMPSDEMQAWYSGLRKHVRGGRREVFTLVD